MSKVNTEKLVGFGKFGTEECLYAVELKPNKLGYGRNAELNGEIDKVIIKTDPTRSCQAKFNSLKRKRYLRIKNVKEQKQKYYENNQRENYLREQAKNNLKTL